MNRFEMWLASNDGSCGEFIVQLWRRSEYAASIETAIGKPEIDFHDYACGC